jgi:hypothetical protein
MRSRGRTMNKVRAAALNLFVRPSMRSPPPLPGHATCSIYRLERTRVPSFWVTGVDDVDKATSFGLCPCRTT